jgi:hypothetical protein
MIRNEVTYREAAPWLGAAQHRLAEHRARLQAVVNA